MSGCRRRSASPGQGRACPDPEALLPRADRDIASPVTSPHRRCASLDRAVSPAWSSSDPRSGHRRKGCREFGPHRREVADLFEDRQRVSPVASSLWRTEVGVRHVEEVVGMSLCAAVAGLATASSTACAADAMQDRSRPWCILAPAIATNSSACWTTWSGSASTSASVPPLPVPPQGGAVVGCSLVEPFLPSEPTG